MKDILIVDDDKDLCNLIAEIACEEGFVVSRATDGFTALDKIRNHNYDLAIIDNRLVGISGLSMLEYIRKMKPDLKIIMMSAYGNERTKRQAKELGAEDFIDKPFDVMDLIERVTQVISD